MILYKKPYLQPYKGKSTRHTCPSCKTKSSFTRYLDGNTGQPIHPTVGKCNREIKCGYHYTPRQYFSDHPELKNNQAKSQPSTHHFPQLASSQSIPSQQSHSNTSDSQSRSPQPHRSSPQHHPRPAQHSANNGLSSIPSEFDHIPYKLVKKSVSCNSNFVRFLQQHFTEEQINKTINKYSLGATKNKEVIFWQIDINGKVRTGKIMQYNPDTGRRVKNRSGAINWVHNKLKYNDPAYANFKLSQCYFGEHLLRMYPNKLVAIVEAEKTAVIGSLIFTNYNWLAAGNLNGLNSDKSKVLEDRYVVLYPDAGCYERWKIKMKQIRNDINCQILISDLIENHATPIQSEAGYDIADYILDQFKKSETVKEEVAETPHQFHQEIQTLALPEQSSQPYDTIDTNPPPFTSFSPTLRQMIKLNPSLLTLIHEFQLVECQ